jgi:hypothetical protein
MSFPLTLAPYHEFNPILPFRLAPLYGFVFMEKQSCILPQCIILYGLSGYWPSYPPTNTNYYFWVVSTEKAGG